ncbi:hypothetical protein GCM10009555_102530 [Acrocarpospora macrocephala]|uniref:HTH asnC-type domain-containing protein n=1 Tax=Acrocarpospora macrocephala TaxID=150177 RepID=A0A5M3WDN2_9ACTN|nr:Lrp/AsnC family transcriptional regulator [Acrocarpospora macrocephala]GES07177.1 hypothetical protein Amac_007720 [Acrocarpospora macrocephala]
MRRTTTPTAARVGRYGWTTGPDVLNQHYDLDDQDKAIVTMLRQDGRAPLARIGEQVGLSADAVRARLARLSGDGILRVIGFVDPRSLGYGCLSTVGLRYHGPIEELVKTLNGHPKITFMVQTVGELNVICEVAARDDIDLADTVAEAFGAIEGVREYEVSRQLKALKWESQGRPRPPATAPVEQARTELDDLDVALLRVLVDAPRSTFRELEAKVEAPYWVVRKRTQALFANGLIHATAVLDRVSTDPVTMACIRIQLAGDTAEGLAALAALPEVAILLLTAGRFHASAEVTCASPEDLAGLMLRMLAIDCVRDVSVLVYARTLVLPRPWRFDITTG